MLTINEPQQSASQNKHQYVWQHPVFDLLFRSHFILASLASIISLTIWLSYMTHGLALSHGGLSPLVWHIHEMIFTFASTVAVGFILTAVQTWTGKSSIKGLKAFLLVVMWVFSHTLFWANTQMTVTIALVLKAFWWLAVIGFYAEIVISTNNRRNFIFIPLLTVMATLNLSIVILDLADSSSLALHLAKTMVLVFVVLITILGGRVIPFFTVNGAKTPPIPPISWLENLVFVLAIGSAILYFLNAWFNLNTVLSATLLISGACQLLRVSKWRSLNTFHVPLLWSLHLAYLFMAAGLIGMGLSFISVFNELPTTYGFHLITIGSIGFMILSMMSRVSLGHTGRMLKIPRIVVIAFILMIAATLTRVVLPALGMVTWGWTISALCWVIAFTIFLFYYTPILTKTRL
ncbi:NnrS family protein [Thalassotalea marina]|uniref:Short-chain dehydrogenase n=1 Tax=Thalassotalea marina TaxID=1673741 RepID=A0A919BHX8_9GAMM|nr:NnrS family protein [Thalassotalea marina]GHF91550.1 short-chain dehydrogenase [Thalassotalea marina]